MHFRKTTLPNGLRVIAASMKDTQTVTVIVAVAAGSKYETKKINGLSHFLEHMLFKGTKKRPKTKDISEALDAIGGEYNAFTGKERTAYYAKVDARHLPLALDVVSDIFLNSKIDEKEIERERGVILQEINMYEDTPMAQVGDIFEDLLYGDQPAGWEIIGSKENIARLKRQDFMNYLQKNYTPSKTVVCVAGNLGTSSGSFLGKTGDAAEKKVFQKVSDIFSKMKRRSPGRKEKVIERQAGPRIKIKKKKTDQVHLILGARAYDVFHPDRFVLSLLANILGGSMSSRLFLSVRERLGLAYYVKSSYEGYTDSGYLAVSAGVDTDPSKAGKTVKTILGELRKIRRTRVGKKELQKSKDNLRGKMALSLESSDEVASFLAEQELSKEEIQTPEEIMKQVEKVSADDIMRVAGKIFVDNKLNLALIGPVDDKKGLEKILRV